MYNYEKPLPAVVYFDPNMAEVLCYAAWKFACQRQIILRQIMMCIHDKLKKSKKGIFWKIQPAFQSRMDSPYVLFVLFFFGFPQVFG